MKWYDAADKYDERAKCELEAVPEEWQRELVALERALSNIMNGGYIQFLVNCGRPTYLYASQAFKKIGSAKTAKLLDRCQALIEEGERRRPPFAVERSALDGKPIVSTGKRAVLGCLKRPKLPPITLTRSRSGSQAVPRPG